MAERRYFGNIEEVIEPPNLIEVQSKSYEDFLQKHIAPSQRTETGLQAVFKEVFPITSYDETIELDFISYDIEDPKITSLDALRSGETFSAALYVTFKLKDETGTKKERVYMGELPMMTRRGTFVINGAERVIVSQLHRSPGICFEKSIHLNGKTLHSFRIIPDRGSWLEVQFDTNDLLYVYLDRRRRRRKFLATTFLRALGYPTERDLISQFYKIKKQKLSESMDEEELSPMVLFEDIKDGDLVVARAYDPLTIGVVRQLLALKIKTIEVIDSRDDEVLLKSLRKDPADDEESALKDIYKKLRPGDPPTASNARALLKRLFFDPKKYDLTRVGRYKINQKLQVNIDSTQRIMVAEDFLAAVKYLLRLKKGEGVIDDIDHLGSRRVRAVGELLANQCRVGLARTERLVKERMTLFDVNIEGMTPQKLINPKALSAVVRDFFGRSQLSQFMDQTNPLAELTHKRRLSALGPGGLNRDRAGFEVRDVHPSHYGRICPIETPEGPNIGLINSMCTYARINEFGFIETPYRKVKKGKVSNQIEYVTADQEETFIIAQANNPIGKDGKFINARVTARERGEFLEMDPEKVHYMDVSPKQLVSVAAGLIPFLEHDDANRALMGSNMQRQGVPLLVSEAPYVGTGLEEKAARDSRAVIVAEADGIVAAATAEFIVTTKDGELPVSDERFLSDPESVKTKADKGIFVYPLRKFMRSNAGTCINQKPLIKSGDKIKNGQILADGPNTENGELALGRNVLVAFMPWNGYNFEDAIVISERMVKEDVYTSIHIDEFDVEIRETKLGREEFTRDIPNVSEKALSHLNEEGIVGIGTRVHPGDILVGKVSPKAKSELTPEEKLLHAIFGRAGEDVKNESLEVPSGVEGIVIHTEKFSRRMSLPEDERKRFEGVVRRAEKAANAKVVVAFRTFLEGFERVLGRRLVDEEGAELRHSEDDRALAEYAERFDDHFTSLDIRSPQKRKDLDTFRRESFAAVREVIQTRDREMNSLKRGDELPSGVLQMVKVYVASKRQISVGDKMAGRHGNKGVISKVLPDEDMPYLEDGTPIDIILNPLGVPSRMNVGQILETHLGWAASKLGFRAICPVFDGAPESQIRDKLEEAGLGRDGKTALFDGRTGEEYEQRVTVGQIYMLKLHHLVDDKVHARATGPYSLITQQPLGGKARFGGQRFGEMEVWALEAYGAAYILQELLTVKSDDVEGRTKIYESMVKGQNTLEAGTPASFDVLNNEIRGLGLNLQLEKSSL